MKKITVLFLFLSSAAFASFNMNENMKQSYVHIMNLEFDAAKDRIKQEQVINSNNGLIVLQENYIDFLTILIGEDYSYFKKNEPLKSGRLEVLKEADKGSPYYLYAQAELHLQWAFSRLKFQEYTTAAYEFIKAYNLLEKNQEKYPEFILNKKGLGILHSLLGAVPSQYHWILHVAGLSGSIELGLNELNQVLNDSTAILYKEEVLFLVSFLQINLTNNPLVCQSYLDKIGVGYKNNYLLNFAAARLSYNLGENDYTLMVLENRPDTLGKYPFYYLDYLLGMSYLYQLDYKNSAYYFDYFLKHFKGDNYIKSAYHKLAWIASLKGDRENELNYFEKVKLSGETFVDEDKVAQKYAVLGSGKKYYIHPGLLKTRLLYDGGYYKRALLEINSIPTVKEYSGFSDEFWYRLARIKSKLNYAEKEIISHYQKASDLGANSSSYYAPMSALQIGLIYEKNKDFKLATIYFEECLSRSDFDYERGIHQKAKAGLERIVD